MAVTRTRGVFVGAVAIALVALLLAIWNASDRVPEPVELPTRESEQSAAVEPAAAGATSGTGSGAPSRTDAKEGDEPAVLESAGVPAAVPMARWSGTFRDGDGQPIPGRRRATARNVATRDARAIAIGADGRFDALLPVGTWQVHDRDRIWLGTVLGTGTLTANGLHRDLVWPGCRIVLTLAAESGAAIDFASAARQLRLTGPERSTIDRSEGPFESPVGPLLQWLVPVGGSYRLTSRGAVDLSGDGPVAIEVEKTARVHHQMVYLR